ncbi:hypothetical protein J5069_02740 [Candidatus Symbiopectobacterium sp. NZEC127]|nr:hypothetical protein [Candidatus Symbiopectobacterium sp. NZEC127]MCW2484807.1 hypothetical protein [Candidatus Symbiopectobacterium sp. NZEC127]
MPTGSVKHIQYQHRVGSHNIRHYPQHKHGLMFPLVIVLAAFSALSLIL